MGSDTRGRLVERLSRVATADARTVVGLSSGTSADGIDAAVVRISGGEALDVELLGFVCVPYDAETSARVSRAPEAQTPELARLHYDLGEAFAHAALRVIDESGLKPADIDIVGSHGQTVFHEPPADGRPGVTLQIGEADVIARSTGVTTVSDFRAADVAAGGSGAPLIPVVDWLLFRHPGEPRHLLNVGGIANLTYVPDSLDDVVAMDTGPGNSLLDAIVTIATAGRMRYDEGGLLALRGEPCDAAVAEFLSLPYFAKPPPKSTGKELFGAQAARRLSRAVHPETEVEHLTDAQLGDVLATAVAVTARSVRAGADLLPPASSVLVSGGGVRNQALMSLLSELLAPARVASLSEAGMDPDAKEAVGFAVLANETLLGHSGNVPRATGATAAVVLGKISPGI